MQGGVGPGPLKQNTGVSKKLPGLTVGTNEQVLAVIDRCLAQFCFQVNAPRPATGLWARLKKPDLGCWVFSLLKRVRTCESGPTSANNGNLFHRASGWGSRPSIVQGR